MTNDNPSPPAWRCLDCQLDGGAGELCRAPDGTHRFEQLSRAYLSEGDLRHRAMDCIGEMIALAPAQAAGFLVVACAQCRSIDELCFLAAGALEDLLEAHGPLVIRQLETLAKVDPRFRLMLSGTWGRSRIDEAVWSRLEAAVAPGPVIDADPRTPAAGMDDKVITAAALAALFSTLPASETRH